MSPKEVRVFDLNIIWLTVLRLSTPPPTRSMTPFIAELIASEAEEYRGSVEASGTGKLWLFLGKSAIEFSLIISSVTAEHLEFSIVENRLEGLLEPLCDGEHTPVTVEEEKLERLVRVERLLLASDSSAWACLAWARTFCAASSSLAPAWTMYPFNSSRSWETCFKISVTSRFWSAKTAKSMLRATPCIRATPLTSCSAVSCPSPPETRLKSMSESRANRLTSQSMEASHCLTMGSTTMSLNSSLSRTPFPSWSAAMKSRDIFVVWLFIARSFWLTMMMSSVAATLKVTCRKTPMMTLTTAKPQMHW
mmetsp:Transcript_106701/g.311911  ORF Transcript_106701/g.311911 Transcript_106701/m.311911 type:complete len:307 (-) Transcript_106701:362-1282(-)